MPLISIRLVAGRSDEELRNLVAGVSEAAAEALEMPIDKIGVHLFELTPDRIGRGGKLVGDSSAEQA